MATGLNLRRWLRAARPPEYTVVFVCMGNICRSPTAHGVFRHRLRQAGLAARVGVESAGTSGLHVGERPDARAIRHAQARGVDLSDLRARGLTAADFARADLIVLMDADNEANARARCPPEHQHKLCRLTVFARRHPGVDEVPDPYYGGPQGFEQVLDLVEDACDGLLLHVQQALRPAPG